MKLRLIHLQTDAESPSGAELGQALDELHTVSALLAGTLAVAEPGSPVERCLSVVSQVLAGVIETLSEFG